MIKSIIEQNYGAYVFTDEIIAKKISSKAFLNYKRVKSSLDDESLNKETASEIASAMLSWAIEKGATHYTHWFQPLTGATAEKHDSFLSFDKDSKPIIEFSEKQLIKGEADASSLPSGGSRMTFEARGYTVWDCTSPAFIKKAQNGTTVLCIPTAFCSYKGDALDKKTPLLRSNQAINKQGMRVLKSLGNTSSKSIVINLGAEQEYFLIDKNDFKKRYDLIFTGRTLFGAMPPKGQEKNDQYYANIRDRVSSFMKDLNVELWQLGVSAKTQHNEAAPAQHELAPVYSSVNIATDQNQLIMEIMKKVAERHDLSCLLHEKPFLGVNGSGKHNNYSICTDDGINLLKPGKNPEDNVEFLVFFMAVVSAVDEYQELLRMTAAHAGNDHRLGAHEAPPAIVSVFTDNMILGVLEDTVKKTRKDEKIKELLNTGVKTLPALSRDFSDRNRTSPFAFTGNKFEFRMVGSSQSTATPNVILNTATAEILRQIADALEKTAEEKRKDRALDIVRDLFIKHRRIIFNGNNYSKEWVEEAEKRGLKNIPDSVSASEYLTDEKTIDLFTKHNVYSKSELKLRQEINYENYANTISIEAQTMLLMAKTQILPACLTYKAEIVELVKTAKKLDLSAEAETEIAKNLDTSINKFYLLLTELENAIQKVEKDGSHKTQAEQFRDIVLPAMNSLRSVADYLETIVSKKYWPVPTYSDILFYN